MPQKAIRMVFFTFHKAGKNSAYISSIPLPALSATKKEEGINSLFFQTVDKVVLRA